MPSYLILRIISFFFAVCVPMFIVGPMKAGLVLVPLTIAHYFLAVPYSKKYIVNVMKRRSTSVYFVALIAVAIIVASLKVRGVLFLLFGIHYVFSEVYLMYENVLPNKWKETRALRISSIACNTFAYFAAIRSPLFNHNHQAEIFNWVGFAVSACVFVYQFLKVKNRLTSGEILQICAFESLGLAFVITGIIHPVSVVNFIYYHILFWILYPSSKMIEFKQTRALAVFLGSNVALTLFLLMIGPFSRFPLHLNFTQWILLFNSGAIIHIIISMGMTSAQPAWITRIFHPEFARGDDFGDRATTAAVPVVREKVLQT